MAARRARACAALLALVATLAAPAHALIDETLDVIFLGKEIGEKVLSSWDIIGKPFNATGGVELPIIKRRESQILARLAQVTRDIDRLELTLEQTNGVSALLARGSGKGTALRMKLHEMADLLGRVSAANRQMREYVRLQRALERSTLEGFAGWCVSHDPGALPGLLERVHALVAPPHGHLLGRGLLDMLVEELQDEQSEVCELQLSPHQLIYDTYNTISLTEIKGYAMMQFSWMLLRIYGKGNYTQEASLTRQRYGERTSQTASAARAALAVASRDLYRCDPPLHKAGETYAEVTRFLQGYIENEVDMNSDGTCRDNCAGYSVAKNHGCFKEQFCAKQNVCKGQIHDCQYIDSDMWVCPAGRTSNRRYEWIEYENGRTFGRPTGCTLGTTKVDSWWRWLFWHCSYCMCLCDEAGPHSDRYFSLMETVSDVKNNKVVTGVRIVKQGRVFHLQISEGVLGERGAVTPSDWVPVQRFDPADAGVREGEDYYKLTYQRRAVDLDMLDSPPGHVLTGVRFRMHGPHLHFEIRSTAFNYATGRLTDRYEWRSNDNTDASENPRKRIELYRPDIPTRSRVPLPWVSQHDQFVEFTHTGFEEDAAQSTVPFVDIQPLQPMKGAGLLSGAGVIYRGARGSGGFLALALRTYDYSAHVSAAPPSSEFDVSDADSTEFTPIIN